MRLPSMEQLSPQHATHAGLPHSVGSVEHMQEISEPQKLSLLQSLAVEWRTALTNDAAAAVERAEPMWTHGDPMGTHGGGHGDPWGPHGDPRRGHGGPWGPAK
jgi:hypothetical protein